MSNRYLSDGWAFEKICPICGKRFYITPDWVYKKSVRIRHRQYGIKYSCSYSCHNKMKGESCRDE